MQGRDLEDDIDHDVLVDELTTPPTQEAAADAVWAERRLRRRSQALIDNLTPREREVLEMRFSGELREDPVAASAAAERAIERITKRMRLKK